MTPGSFSDPIMAIIDKHPECMAKFLCEESLSIYTSPLMQELYEYHVNNPDAGMPYGTMKARTGDPDVFLMDVLEKYSSDGK